jgi:hypothetical protein
MTLSPVSVTNAAPALDAHKNSKPKNAEKTKREFLFLVSISPHPPFSIMSVMLVRHFFPELLVAIFFPSGLPSPNL